MMKITFEKVRINQQFTIEGNDFPLVRIGALAAVCLGTDKRHVIYPKELVRVKKEVKK